MKDLAKNQGAKKSNLSRFTKVAIPRKQQRLVKGGGDGDGDGSDFIIIDVIDQ